MRTAPIIRCDGRPGNRVATVRGDPSQRPRLHSHPPPPVHATPQPSELIFQQSEYKRETLRNTEDVLVRRNGIDAPRDRDRRTTDARNAEQQRPLSLFTTKANDVRIINKDITRPIQEVCFSHTLTLRIQIRSYEYKLA